MNPSREPFSHSSAVPNQDSTTQGLKSKDVPCQIADPRNLVSEERASSPHKNPSSEERDPSTYESLHVHSIYNKIATHFSSTRYKPWPIVSRFLLSLPPGSIGLDIGCGNGKYLSLNPGIFILGSDTSLPLLECARDKINNRDDGGDTSEKKNSWKGGLLQASALQLPHRMGSVDFVISIAVIHHLSTRQRRVDGVREILSCLKASTGAEQGGKALLYVWALEQKTSRRGWDEGDEQDVMVPWVLKGSNNGEEREEVYQRYYHLYRKGELEEDVASAGGRVVDGGYEKDNWWIVAVRDDDNDDDDDETDDNRVLCYDN